MWSDRDREAEEAGERRLGRAAAVEAEHELVEPRVRLAGPRPGSGLEVLLAQAVVDAQGPPLRVREHAVDPGRRFLREVRQVTGEVRAGRSGPPGAAGIPPWACGSRGSGAACR